MSHRTPSRLYTMMLLVCLALLVSSVAAAANKITVIWHGNPNAALVEAIKKFEQSTGISVEIELGSGWDAHYQKLALRMAAGVPFDVAGVDGESFSTAAQGVFADLTPFMERDNISNDTLTATAVDTFRTLGGVYALPNQVHTIGLFYNIDMFDAAGLVHPTQDWGSDAWTWTEFVNVAKKLTHDNTGNGLIDQIGMYELTNLFVPWFWGGDWTNEDASASMLNAPEVARGVQEFADLRNLHGVMPGAIPAELPSNTFWAGRAGMSEGPTFSVRSITTAPFETGVAALPKGTERATVMYADGFAMGALSENKEAAWEFIKYFSAIEEGAWDMSVARGSLPALRSLQPDFVWRMREAMPQVPYDVYIQGLSHSRILTYRQNLNGRQVAALISEAQKQTLSGTQSAQAALAAVHPQVDALLKEGFVAP